MTIHAFDRRTDRLDGRADISLIDKTALYRCSAVNMVANTVKRTSTGYKFYKILLQNN